MSSKTMEEKIDSLNDLTGGTLCMACYTVWELSSYGKNSLFSFQTGRFGVVRAPSFEQCIDRAYGVAVRGCK